MLPRRIYPNAHVMHEQPPRYQNNGHELQSLHELVVVVVVHCGAC